MGYSKYVEPAHGQPFDADWRGLNAGRRITTHMMLIVTTLTSLTQVATKGKDLRARRE
jgi:hypothetical protein